MLPISQNPIGLNMFLGLKTVIPILRAYIGNGYWKTFHWRDLIFSWRRYAVIVDTVCEVLTPGKCWKDM